MVAPDTADLAKSPPAKSPSAKSPPTTSPSAKLSSIESSPIKPFPTLDLIPVTSNTTLDRAPANLPFQALESLYDGFFPDRYFNSIQEAVEIAVKKLTPHNQSKFMHGIYELFADIHKISNAQVAWLSNFEENNAGWRELGNKRYYDYLSTIDSSGRPPEPPKTPTPAPNRQIPSASPVLIPSASHVLISSAPLTEEEKLSDFEAPTPSESLFSEDSSPQIPDIPDTTPHDVTEIVDDVTEVVNDVTEVVDDVAEVVDDVTEVADDVTEVLDDDAEATSSDNESSNNESSDNESSDNESCDNESSETGVTPTPIRTKASRKRKTAG
ncbi:hypothetical protein K440DRAFT_636809 [Wilcoxina mikolae CBS 423.85]|nr:hypothetical protein K440DRAFT_636809 [Wilcoxina mikolae CBS 423.85]